MKRVFLGWDRPALPRAAAVLCDHYEDGDAVLRLDRALVALPGARAGRRLKELLVAEARRRGVPLVPPRVTTVGAVPELLYEPQRPIATPVAARRVWAEVLQAFDRHVLATLFARLPDADALPEWARLGRELHSLHRDVAAGALRFPDVADRCCDSPLYDDSRRWRMLARLQADYEARLAELGLADLDLARLDALADTETGTPIGTDLDLWIVGAAEMPGVVRHMIAAADRTAGPAQGGSTGVSTVTALVHAPESRADAFDELGCVIPGAWLEAEIPLDEDQLHVVDGPEDQADVVAETLRGLDGRFAADEIVLGVPDREMVPYLEQRLEAAGVPTRAAAGTPVSRTGPFRLLTGVTDYLDGRRFETLAALARDPDLGRWLVDPSADMPGLRRPDGWLGPVDRWYNDHLPARIRSGDERGRERARRSDGAAPKSTAGGQLELGFETVAAAAPAPDPEPHRSQRAEDRDTVQALIHRIDTLVAVVADPASSPGTAGLAHWAERSLRLLETVYGDRRLDPDVPAHRRLIRALDRIGRAARSVIELPEPLDVRCAAPQALRLVLDEAAGESVPPAGERAAVELLGWLELHLDDAPVAVVTGMNEPHVPESVSAHAFLPDHLRTRLGLEDNDRRYARDAYQLTAALHARPHLRLVAGRRAGSGDPLRPSRLLFATTPDAAARRVRRFYDEEVREPAGVATGVGATALAASESRSRSSFMLPPEPVITARHPLERLRATDFSAIIADPYTFALSRILGLDSLDDAAREMDPLRFGTLAHRVLERFGRDQEVVNVPDVDVASHRLDELLEHEVARRFGDDAHVAVGIQVAQLRSRLHAFARWHADWIADGWRVVAAECGTPDDGIPMDVDGVPCGITARIDRVDHRPATGEWAVFDYKTGDSGKSPGDTHRSNRDSEWADLQLPLYRWLLPQLTDDEGAPIAPGAATAPVRVGYITLSRDLESIEAKFADWSDHLFDEAIDRARDLVRLVRTNRFEHDPSARPKYPDPALEALLGLGHLAGETEEEVEWATE